MLGAAKKLAAVAAVLLLGVTVAPADFSNVVFHVTATNATGTGEYSVPVSALHYNATSHTWTWNTFVPVALQNGSGDTVATLNQATLSYRVDGRRQINMGYVLVAGGTQTTFVVDSALYSFPTIDASLAEGRASASLGVTDTNGDGVTLNALGPPGTGAYWAQYNGFVPTGATFSNLIANVQAGPGGSGGATQNDPLTGYRVVGASVSDMSAEVAFTLTAGDMTSATTNYEILPEPASIVLLSLGALAFWKRRR